MTPGEYEIDLGDGDEEEDFEHAEEGTANLPTS
jgi:hypothetical protein